jgi:hypothetical protein
MACEEAEMYYRWNLLEQIAKGEMPAGMTEEDLRAMELPMPGEVEMVEEADCSVVIKRVAKPAPPVPATRGKSRAKANAFVCDTPDDK